VGKLEVAINGFDVQFSILIFLGGCLDFINLCYQCRLLHF
jgi:hypothetical protein